MTIIAPLRFVRVLGALGSSAGYVSIDGIRAMCYFAHWSPRASDDDGRDRTSELDPHAYAAPQLARFEVCLKPLARVRVLAAPQSEQEMHAMLERQRAEEAALVACLRKVTPQPTQMRVIPDVSNEMSPGNEDSDDCKTFKSLSEVVRQRYWRLSAKDGESQHSGYYKPLMLLIAGK